MKITSINFVNAENVPKVAARNTQNSQTIATILENLERLTKEHPAVKVGDKMEFKKQLILTGDDIKKYERYALQKSLQKRGAKVLVTNGNNPATGKPCLFVRRLTDKEWQEWLVPAGTEVEKAPRPVTKK